MNLKIEKAFISFRISPAQWMPEKRFRELLDWFEKYKGVTDEVSFFPDVNHAPVPLETIKQRAALLAERIPEVRKLGYKATINNHCTVGHHERSLHNSLSEDYTRMTGIDGQICLGSFCPNDERMRDYIRQLYAILVSAEPDYIWIDDDVRLSHRPAHLACFCDNCLRIFEKECHVKYTRETLRVAFNEGSIEEKFKVRKAWLQHNCNTFTKLFELIEQTVHRLKPGLPLGFMSGDLFFEGYDFQRWAEILAGPAKAEVRWRPGGGFYWDDCLRELIGKSHGMGMQAAMLSDSVVSIQSEIENCPYERLRKAAHTTALEAASHMAAGCTGAAFNVVSPYDEPLDEYEPLIAKLRQTRPFYDLLAREMRRTKPQGLHTGWNKNSFAAKNISEGDWFSKEGRWGIAGEHADQIREIGIPACYSPEYASVFALTGDNVAAMTDDEILQILSSGVYMDAQALDRLNKMGYAEFTGFELGRFVEKDCMEEFTDDPLNSVFAGRHRNGLQTMSWGEPASMVNSVAASARILAKALDDYTHREIAPCCMGVFENRLGGRICVSGYYPWTFLQNLSKSSQIKSVMRWLSKDRLLAYVASFHKINLWVRRTEEGRLAVAMINSYLDMAEGVTLMLLTDCGKIEIFDMTCAQAEVSAQGSDGSYKRFTLPTIEPWHMRFILA